MTDWDELAAILSDPSNPSLTITLRTLRDLCTIQSNQLIACHRHFQTQIINILTQSTDVIVLRACTQFLSNLLTANSTVQDRVWPDIITSKSLHSIFESPDEKIQLYTSMAIHNAIFNSPDRSAVFVEGALHVIESMLQNIQSRTPELVEIIFSILTIIHTSNLSKPLLNALPYYSKTAYIRALLEMPSPSLDSYLLISSTLTNLLEIPSSYTLGQTPQLSCESRMRQPVAFTGLHPGAGECMQSLLYIFSQILDSIPESYRSKLVQHGLLESILLILYWADIIQPRSTLSKPSSNDALMYVKRDAIKCLGTLSYRSTIVQDEVRRLGFMGLVLSQCRVDDLNPFIREYALVTIRHLTLDNIENQAIIRGLEAKGLEQGSKEELEGFGLTARLKGGKVDFEKVL